MILNLEKILNIFFLLSNYGNRMGKVFYRGNICSLR